MACEQPQASDILMEPAAHGKTDEVATHRAGEGPGQRCHQAEIAAAGKRRRGEQQHHAGHQQAGDGQRFHQGNQEYRQPQPARVATQPAEQLAGQQVFHASGTAWNRW